MKVFVTGGSGFLGFRTVIQLISAGHDVWALTRSEKSAQILRQVGVHPLPGDLDTPRDLESTIAVSNPDIFLNIASLGFGHAESIVSAAESYAFKHCVFVSTTAISTRLNAKSKEVRVQAEQRIQSSSIPWTILRPTMIYGARGDRNIERLLVALKRYRVLPLPGGGQHFQQPVHVDDVAQALLAASQTDKSLRKIYEIAGPTPISFRELVMTAQRVVASRTRLVSVPIKPIAYLLRVYGLLHNSPRITEEQVMRLTEDKVFDIDPARYDLGFAPRSFETGVRQEVLDLWPN